MKMAWFFVEKQPRDDLGRRPNLPGWVDALKTQAQSAPVAGLRELEGTPRWHCVQLVEPGDGARAFDWAEALARKFETVGLSAFAGADNFTFAVFGPAGPILAIDGGHLPARLVAALPLVGGTERRALRGNLQRAVTLTHLRIDRIDGRKGFSGQEILNRYCQPEGEAFSGDFHLASEPMVVQDLLHRFGVDVPTGAGPHLAELWFSDEARARHAPPGPPTGAEAERIVALAASAPAPLPSATERRALVKKSLRVSGLPALAEVVSRYGGALERGDSLFSDEKLALRAAREKLVSGLAEVLGASPDAIDERLRAAQR